MSLARTDSSYAPLGSHANPTLASTPTTASAALGIRRATSTPSPSSVASRRVVDRVTARRPRRASARRSPPRRVAGAGTTATRARASTRISRAVCRAVDAVDAIEAIERSRRSDSRDRVGAHASSRDPSASRYIRVTCPSVCVYVCASIDRHLAMGLRRIVYVSRVRMYTCMCATHRSSSRAMMAFAVVVYT